jgi:hypothetical protein
MPKQDEFDPYSEEDNLEKLKQLHVEEEKRNKKFEEFQLDDWRLALSGPSGRAILGQLILFCRTMEVNTEQNPQASGYREGLRAAGLFIFAKIKAAAPNKYLEILREAEAVSDFFNTATIAELNRARDLFK